MKLPIYPILAFVLTVLPVHAAAPDLYSGSADVADQSAAERERAMPLALAEVLRKLSGLASFEDRPEVQLALEPAPALAVSFHYRNRPVPQPDATETDRLQLVVDFSRQPVDELVRALQLPLWPPDRQPLTVWFVVEDDLGRRIMPIEFEYVLAQVKHVAAGRGLPVVLPQPDAEGNYAVDAQLLWGGYTEELSEDGPADALVIAALRDGPEWNVRMNLDYGGERWSWRERGIDLPPILVEGMHRAVSEIATVRSIAPSDLARSSHEITVGGIIGTDDYAECLGYLQGLTLVEDVRVIAAAPGRLRLGLELNALPDHLARSLRRDGVLVPAGADGEWQLAPDPLPEPAPEPPSVPSSGADEPVSVPEGSGSEENAEAPPG